MCIRDRIQTEPGMVVLIKILLIQIILPAIVTLGISEFMRKKQWIIVCQVMICPTSPAVPMPEPVALLVICSTMVPTGPSTALDNMAGSQITGFLTMFGTCNIDVPIPCARRPPILFSL